MTWNDLIDQTTKKNCYNRVNTSDNCDFIFGLRWRVYPQWWPQKKSSTGDVLFRKMCEHQTNPISVFHTQTQKSMLSYCDLKRKSWQAHNDFTKHISHSLYMTSFYPKAFSVFFCYRGRMENDTTRIAKRRTFLCLCPAKAKLKRNTRNK